jgi:hypothetical protein
MMIKQSATNNIQKVPFPGKWKFNIGVNGAFPRYWIQIFIQETSEMGILLYFYHLNAAVAQLVEH